MKRFLIFFLSLALLLSSCGSQTPRAIPAGASITAPIATPEPKTLTVFAPASLINAFSEIGQDFENAHPGVTIKFNFGGSQSIRAQNEQGAQADVFASANVKEMDALVAGQFVAADNVKSFVTNQLIVIMPASNPAGLAALADLSKPGLKLILAAGEVPVGNYALQVLDKLELALGAGFKDKVLKNVVSYENDVKLVVAKVQLGEADAGIVYLSDTVAAPDLMKIEIPAENNVVARYLLAALNPSSPAPPGFGDNNTGTGMTTTKISELAQAFIAYLLSANGQAILEKWGFLPVK